MDPVVCPQCRTDVPSEARFCPSCGHELVVVGDQRRIATVLFADLVGFTSLSEHLDPEQVKALVDRCFERLAADIESFGGRVDKVVGDAIVALFGAPIAHEDDAERAVRAGLRMQQTIGAVAGEVDHPVQIRVGVNTGEVLVGAVRAGREYTAMGDVVNTASRLQAAAEPGTVLVGPTTHATTRSVVAYDSIDPVHAKGKELPVEAWVAREAIVPPGHRPRRVHVPIVGRDTELSLLTSVSATAIDRSRAALLIVHGEAGMGKSRLAEEAFRFAEHDLGALVLEGRCVPYGEANVWWPVADAIRSAAGVDSSTPTPEVDDKLRRISSRALHESNRIDELDRVVTGLHHLLGNESSLRGIDVARARDEAIRSVVALAEGYTHRQPVMVVLSDLHWADQEVLDLVDTLLARLARRPFVLLATARRALGERWNPSPEAANSVVLHLDPLDAEASRRLLHMLTEGEMHPSLAAMLVDRAGGNPFYLEELVALVGEAGVGTVDQLLATEAGELPDTLRGLVAARLDALPPTDRTVLDDAAVLGRRSKIAALATMADVKRGIDAETARAHIENLAAREFLVLDGDTYAFRSEVIREVAYSTLTKADRARAHAGIAHWIEENEDSSHEHTVDQIANHYAAAAELVADVGRISSVPDDVADRAVTWLTRAARRADGDFIPAATAALAGRALDLLPDDDPRRGELLRLRADARVDRYELDGAEDDALAALELASAAGDQIAVARVQLVLGEVQQHRGDAEGSVAVLDDARRRFHDAGDSAGEAVALRQIGMTKIFAGDFPGADAALLDALARFEELGDARNRAWAHQNLSWSAYVSGRVDEAEERVVEAMQTFQELGDPGGLTWSRGLLAWVRFHQGHNEEALELASAVGADARERGELWGEAMMVVLTGAISLWAGRTDEAVATLRRAAGLFERIDDQFGAIQARCGLARALVMTGAIDRGLDELRDLRASHPETADQVLGFERITSLALSVQLGDTVMGEEVLSTLGGHGGDDVVGAPDQMVAVALHCLQCGDRDGARRAIEQVDEARGLVAAGRSLVAAASGDVPGTFDAADEVADLPHTYLDVVFAEVGRAVALVTDDRPDEARAVLARTLEVVDATGDQLAQALVRLADAAVAEVAGRTDAATVRRVAEHRLADLRIDAAGWRSLLADSLGVSLSSAAS
ncbi:MAG: adenylate/guanylate cyclase domain-containing protein [Acidimicrobiales bacterium]|nr:adenylate/guanylate cyclase domain-containing protein [Acidimicrobiales bacterium]